MQAHPELHADPFDRFLPQPVFFCAPSRLVMADGAIGQVAALLAAQGWTHGLLVTDRFFSQASPWVDLLKKDLQAVGIQLQVFDEGMPDPTVDLCDQATAMLSPLHASRPFDHVIALGGGSNIDLAKALSLTLAVQQPVRELVGVSRWAREPLPMVAIPTTAGTGSEITPGTILVDPNNPTKVAVMGNGLRPKIAIIDAELTLSCPPSVTADAGIDALTHAIESLLTQDASEFDRGGSADPGYSGRNALTMPLALQAVRWIFRALPRAMEQPDHLPSRRMLAYASVYAALSYGSAGLNAVHGLAYALAGITHDTHGSTNAVFLPYVMDALVEQRRQELEWIAQAALNTPGQGQAHAAASLTRDLIAKVGMRTRLPEFGIASTQLNDLVREGLAVTRLAKAFPGGALQERYHAIVHAAFHGTLHG
jgi:alcohol dehydrogenase